MEETEVFMADFAGALGASKACSALMVLFIPSKDRSNQPVNQRHWVKETLNYLEIRFPLEETPVPKQRKATKRE